MFNHCAKFPDLSFLFFKCILLIMLLQVSHFFLPFIPVHPSSPLPPAFPPLVFMSMGHTYKFFGFSIIYTMLNLPLSILYLPFMLLIPCIFPPILPSPINNPPYDLHCCDSVPVLVVCLVWLFVCFLGSVVNSCKFVVILLFIVLILFFLDKSL